MKQHCYSSPTRITLIWIEHEAATTLLYYTLKAAVEMLRQLFSTRRWKLGVTDEQNGGTAARRELSSG
jgi:hypothetical protein